MVPRGREVTEVVRVTHAPSCTQPTAPRCLPAIPSGHTPTFLVAGGMEVACPTRKQVMEGRLPGPPFSKRCWQEEDRTLGERGLQTPSPHHELQ